MRIKIGFSLLTGIMLGLSFPPFETGVLAVFAFLPMLILFETFDSYKETFRYSYLIFFVLNAITVYWAGGFTHGKDVYLMVAGSLLLIAHPLFFTVPILVWLFIRKHLGMRASLLAFPFIWVTFEYAHSLSEIAFPWLILGNTQSYDLPAIQVASLTGVYGISFWLCWLNILIYFLYRKVAQRQWKPFSVKSILAVIGIFLVYLAPKIYGNEILSNQSLSASSAVSIGIVQPNIDPFEKWQNKPDPQLSILQQLTNTLVPPKIDLILWPETAVPFFFIHQSSDYHFQIIKRQVDSSGVALLTGIPDVVYYADSVVPPRGYNVSATGQPYETFNGSMLLQPHRQEIQKYAKMILAPFAERVPFSDLLSMLNAAKWNFGLGGWNRGHEQTVFNLSMDEHRSIKFSTMICYESAFPGFVASFVRNGAQFLTILTNDSWWGNTSGAYQHKQIAVMRAVENRRWIAQCTNGGVSCFINPFGVTTQSTSMFVQTTLASEIETRTDITVYTKYGDWFALLCGVLTLTVLMLTLGNIFLLRMQRNDS